jgi:hypothetical protein
MGLLLTAASATEAAPQSAVCAGLLERSNLSAEQQALVAFRCRKPVPEQSRTLFEHFKSVETRSWDKLPWQNSVADWHRLEKTVEWAERADLEPVEVLFNLDGATRARQTKVRRGLLGLSVRMAFCLDAGYSESAVNTIAHFARKDPEAVLEEIFAVERRLGANAQAWELECGRSVDIESSSPVAESLGISLVEAMDEAERAAFQRRISKLRNDRREFQGREIEAFFVQFETTSEE